MGVRSHRDRSKTVTRRALILGGIAFSLTGILAGQLYRLQIVEGDRYRLLADRNRIRLRPVLPNRGRILDRFDRELARNEPRFSAAFETDEVTTTSDLVSRLVHLLGLREDERQLVLDRYEAAVPGDPTILINDLDWHALSIIEVNAVDLPGLSVLSEDRRVYPPGKAIGHLIGYVSPPTTLEVSASEGRLTPMSRVGRTGAERLWQPRLYGRNGVRTVEVDASGREVRELERYEPEPGVDLAMTIDLGLQEFLSERLSSSGSVAAVVLNANTGEALAISSTPSYDPNLFVGGIRQRDWETLLSDPLRPLFDKAVGGEFAPGSTFKMIVALAALEGGVTTPERTVFCPGYFRLGDATFHCWKRGGHGHVNVTDAIEQSCDVYFYDAALRIGVDAISEMGRRFGLGQRPGSGLDAERPGLLPTMDWKAAQFGQEWHSGETVVAGIGQGYVTTTPLQLAIMIARLANGGQAIKPILLRDQTVTQEGTAAPSVGVSERWLALIKDAMVRVTNGPRGTARRARITELGFEMGGKTGTSQVRRISAAERRYGVFRNQDLPWDRRDHALFVGFAPIDRPLFAASVVVEHGGGGSAVAAPIARDLLLEAQRRALVHEGVNPA